MMTAVLAASAYRRLLQGTRMVGVNILCNIGEFSNLLEVEDTDASQPDCVPSESESVSTTEEVGCFVDFFNKRLKTGALGVLLKLRNRVL